MAGFNGFGATYGNLDLNMNDLSLPFDSNFSLPVPAMSRAMHNELSGGNGVDEAALDAVFTDFLLSQITQDGLLGHPPASQQPQTQQQHMALNGPPSLNLHPSTLDALGLDTLSNPASMGNANGLLSFGHTQQPGMHRSPSAHSLTISNPASNLSVHSMGVSPASDTNMLPFTATPAPTLSPSMSRPARVPVPLTQKPGTGMQRMRVDDEDEEQKAKRSSHIVSEQRRRDHMKDAFKDLEGLMPNVRPGTTRVRLLQRAVEYMASLKRQVRTLQEQLNGQGLPPDDSQLFAQLVEAVAARLGTNAASVRILYRDDLLKRKVELTSPDELRDVFRSVEGDDIKLTVLLRKPHEWERMFEENKNSMRVSEAAQLATNDRLAYPATNCTFDEDVFDRDFDELEEESLLYDDEPSVAAIEAVYNMMRNHPLRAVGCSRYVHEEWQCARIRRALKVCDHDVNDAYQFLTSHLEWINTVRPDKIQAEEVFLHLQANVLYWHCTDLNGYPCLIFRATKNRSIVQPTKEQGLKLWLHRLWEFEEKRADNPYAKFVIIYDRQGSQTTQGDLAVFKRLARIFQVNYAEQIHRIYVLNGNYIFRYGFGLLRPVMTRRFRSLFRILDHERWQEQLLSHFGRENLEPDFGGTSVPVMDAHGIIVA